MRLKQTLLVASLLVSSIAFAASQQENLNGFDFNYSVDLNKKIGLTQVFDDGDRTYFQFTEAENLPTLYVVKDGKKQLISVEVRPPYLIAAGVASKYALSTNNGKTSIYVSYNGKRTNETIPQNTLESAAQPVQKTTVKTEVEAVETQNGKQKVPVKKDIATKSKESADLPEKVGVVKKQELGAGVLLNVPFFENSVSLSKKTKADLLRCAPEITSASKVVVRGRPSVRGDVNIANTRALVIKNYLAEIGVSESVIETAQEQSVKLGKNTGFYISEIILMPISAQTLNIEKKKAPQQAITPTDASVTEKLKKADITAKEPVAPNKLTDALSTPSATDKNNKEIYQAPNVLINLKKGENIHAALEAAAKINNYILNWEGEELYSKYETSFESASFDKSVDSLLTAIKVNGYISGNVIYVVVK